MSEQISVLLVEDQNADLFVDVLRQFNGFDITVARDGNQALLHAHSTKFDIIVLDIRIPFQDGYAVVRQIRSSNDPNKKTPIIAMSAYTDKKTRERIAKAGADEFLARPFNFFELYKKMLKLVVAFPRDDRAEREELFMLRRRLNKLRLQKAQFGMEVPPHIQIEIEDLEKEIRERSVGDS